MFLSDVFFLEENDLRPLASTTNGYYGEQQLPSSAIQMGYSNQPAQGTQGYYAAQQQPQGSTYGYVNYPANQAADGGCYFEYGSLKSRPQRLE